MLSCGEHSVSYTNMSYINASAYVHHHADIAHFLFELYTNTAKAVPCNSYMLFVPTSSFPCSHMSSIPLLPPIQRYSGLTNGHSLPVFCLSAVCHSDDWKKGGPGLCSTGKWFTQVLNLAVYICCMQHCIKRTDPFVIHLLELPCWQLVWSAETGLLLSVAVITWTAIMIYSLQQHLVF
jgi:hypothetical protein